MQTRYADVLILSEVSPTTMEIMYNNYFNAVNIINSINDNLQHIKIVMTDLTRISAVAHELRSASQDHCNIWKHQIIVWEVLINQWK